MSTPSARPLCFCIIGQHIEVRCDVARLREVVAGNFAAFREPACRPRPDSRYEISLDAASGAFRLSSPHGGAQLAATAAELLFDLEKSITLALQTKRPDLLFLHAAALERDRRAYLLSGESGHGKSTTAWGLLHHGFRYLSDELSAIDLRSRSVLAYSHALCLKQRPPAGYPLPEAEVLDLGATIHVPVAALPAAVATAPCSLGAVLFVRHDAGLRRPALRPIGTAEAAARMYVSTLNALAHEAHGLDAVLRVVGQVPCFVLDSADLRSTCELIAGTDLRTRSPPATAQPFTA
jgi:hypothetical protein